MYPELIPPTVPEVRRIIQAMSGPEAKREFRVGWSLFRRAHQAVAKRCHKVTRQLTEQNMPPTITTSSSSKILIVGEEVAPTQPRPAKLAHERGDRLRPKRPVFSPTPSGSALERYCRGKSQARGVRGATTAKYSGGYSGSWIQALGGGTYQRRNLGRTARLTVGTASGARKDSGIG